MDSQDDWLTTIENVSINEGELRLQFIVGNWLVLQWLLRQFPSISGWGIIADFLKAALLAFDSLCLLLM